MSRQPDTSDTLSILEGELSELQTSEKLLEQIIKELKQQLLDIDKLINQYAELWLQHSNEHVAKLIVELEAIGIQLSDLEKLELKSGTKTISQIRQKLKDFNITFPAAANEFTIRTYDSILSAYSRKLDKIDNEIMIGLIGKLKGLLDVEDHEANEKKVQQQKQFQPYIDSAKQNFARVDKLTGLSNDQVLELNRLQKQIAAIEETTAKAAPLTKTTGA